MCSRIERMKELHDIGMCSKSSILPPEEEKLFEILRLIINWGEALSCTEAKRSVFLEAMFRYISSLYSFIHLIVHDMLINFQNHPHFIINLLLLSCFLFQYCKFLITCTIWCCLIHRPSLFGSAPWFHVSYVGHTIPGCCIVPNCS